MQSLYVNVLSEALQVINAVKGGDDLSIINPDILYILELSKYFEKLHFCFMSICVFNGAAHCLAKWGNSYFIDVEWVDNFSDWLSKLVSVL